MRGPFWNVPGHGVTGEANPDKFETYTDADGKIRTRMLNQEKVDA